MTEPSTLSSFAARLRGLIQEQFQARSHARVAFSNEGMFPEQALELFSLQFEHNLAYRTFCLRRRATPGTVRNWQDIPAIPTAAFKELELTSLPAEERIRVFHSSGTTEQRPSRHFHSQESLELYEASLLTWFREHLMSGQHLDGGFALTPALSPGRGRAKDDGSRVSSSLVTLADPDGCSEGSLNFLMLTPPPGLAPHSSLVHMFEAVGRKFASGGAQFAGVIDESGNWSLDFESALQALQRSIERNHPTAVLGTAFGFVQLCDFLSERGTRLRMPEGSRVMETGGYKGRSRALPREELHDLISRKLGIPREQMICEYGMSELSSQAYDHSFPNPALRLFRFPPWARAQVISPETGREVPEGETGLIRVFDLANVWSVMAIQTEDLGVRRGDGFELIGRAALSEPRGCSLMSA